MTIEKFIHNLSKDLSYSTAAALIIGAFSLKEKGYSLAAKICLIFSILTLLANMTTVAFFNKE